VKSRFQDRKRIQQCRKGTEPQSQIDGNPRPEGEPGCHKQRDKSHQRSDLRNSPKMPHAQSSLTSADLHKYLGLHKTECLHHTRQNSKGRVNPSARIQHDIYDGAGRRRYTEFLCVSEFTIKRFFSAEALRCRSWRCLAKSLP